MAIPTDLDRIPRCEASGEPSFKPGEGAHAIGAHFSLAAIRLGPVGASPGYGLAHMPGVSSSISCRRPDPAGTVQPW